MVSRLEKWCEQALAKQSSLPDPSGQLAKLTVVVPSWGRQDFILRQMVYWGHQEAKVVIVDGSPRPLSGHALRILSTLPTVHYLHSADTISARLHLATKQIQTPYVVMLGDDEFLLKEGLSRAIEKLENSPDLVACIGQSLRFYPSCDGKTLTYGPGYPHWRWDVTQDTMRARLISAMANYNAASCYAVFREPIWTRTWGAIRPWSCIYAAELQQAMSTYCFGKVSSIDEVYWMRSFENSAVVTKSDANPRLMFSEWWRAPRYKEECAAFVDTLTKDAVSTGQADPVEARQTILDGVAAYLELCSPRRRTVSIDAVRRGLRLGVANVFRSALPEKQFLKLKARLKLKQVGSLGGLEQIRDTHVMNTVFVGEALAAELAALETLISSFWQARLGHE